MNTVLTADVLELIRCPHDGSGVVLRDSLLECLMCKRRYAVLAEGFLEVLPSQLPVGVWNDCGPQDAERAYLQECKRQFSWERTSGSGWGDLTTANAGMGLHSPRGELGMSTVAVKQCMKRLIAAAVGCRGLRKRTNLSVILNYHSVHPANEYSTHPNDFAEQMAYLSNEFHVLSLSEFRRARAEGTELVDKVAVVTFDDGYEDNYEYALPILDECEIPATVFLTTGFVNGELDITQEHVAYRGLKSLTWEHVAQMKGSRISFGAHTHTHPMLSKITRKEVEEELSKCKEILEKRLMEPVDMFAYPFGWRGSFDDHIKKNLRGCGFTLACSTIWGSDNRNTDILALRRIRIDAVDTLKDFRQKVNGCWDFVRLFQVGK